MVKNQKTKPKIKIRKNPNEQNKIKKFSRKLTLFDSQFTRNLKNHLGKATDGIMDVKEMIKIEKYLESKGKRGGRRTRKKKRGGKQSLEELKAKLEQEQNKVDDMIGKKQRKERMLAKMKEIHRRSLEQQQKRLEDLQTERAKIDEKKQEGIINQSKIFGGKRKTKKRRRKKRRKRKSKRKRRK